MKIERYTIHVQDAVLDNLTQRLQQTRWPGEIAGSGWTYGADLNNMKELRDYWLDGYSWRSQETMLNQFSHFKTDIDGLGVHFIHERGKGPNPIPLIISHGWPGSFLEMIKVLPLLTDPANNGGDPLDSFDVIVPSLPGFGFSDAFNKPGMGPANIADLWAKLMTKLGYDRFFAQGGDWGGAVTTALGLNFPERVTALHLNYIAGRFLLGGTLNEPPTDPEAQRHLLELRHWWEHDGGYNHQQSTFPQTLAYALNDSPMGLAAWFFEKFRAWSDCNGRLEDVFTRDELLTNVMLYWVTGSINSSMRIYYESRKAPLNLSPQNMVKPPVGVALFPKEVPMPPRSLAERGYNIVRWNAMERGGHFAAMEQPELFAGEIREFFRSFR